MDGAFFTVDQLSSAGLLGDGDAGWWVDWGGSYRGKVVAPESWPVEEVCAGLNRLASALGENVTKGRLYSRTRVDGAA
jgi:hypothetical protein